MAGLPTPPSLAMPPVVARNKTNNTNKLECVICCELLDPGQLIRPCRKCAVKWCASCLQISFRLVIEKKGSFLPPTCHGIIQLHTIIDHLEQPLIDAYRAAFEEWLTKDRVYCPMPTCSAFIPERHVPSRDSSNIPQQPNFQCPKCNAQICSKCRQVGHAGPCDETAKQEEEAMLAKFNIKQCPRCRRAVRKMYGCSTMACLCGAHFCYKCGESSDDCDGACGSGMEEGGEGDSQTTDGEGDEDSDSDESEDEEGVHRTEDGESKTARLEGSGDSKDKAKLEKGESNNLENPSNPESVVGDAPMPPQQDAGLQVMSREDMEKVLESYRSDGHQAQAPGLPKDDRPYLGPPRSAHPLTPRPIENLPRLPAALRPSRPSNESATDDLDAGGEARWAMAGDFGEEPEESVNSQVWSCLHNFSRFWDQFPEDGSHGGNFDKMGCNRCFSKIVPVQSMRPSLSGGSPEAKRRKISQTGHSVTVSEQDRSLQAIECRDCGLLVCKACSQKYKTEQDSL
ncbi:hypothetical protein Q7P37_003981 [Cladosporium fusiforme]